MNVILCRNLDYKPYSINQSNQIVFTFSLVDRRGIHVPEVQIPPTPIINGNNGNNVNNLGINENNAVNQTFHESYGATTTSSSRPVSNKVITIEFKLYDIHVYLGSTQVFSSL